MLCAHSWLQQAITARREHLIVVLDEAWRVLRHLHVARWLRASWTLTRVGGVHHRGHPPAVRSRRRRRHQIRTARTRTRPARTVMASCGLDGLVQRPPRVRVRKSETRRCRSRSCWHARAGLFLHEAGVPATLDPQPLARGLHLLNVPHLGARALMRGRGQHHTPVRR